MLPALTPEEALHSAALANLVRTRIRECGGAITFDTFMELALYAPGLGYYSAGSLKLGSGGDFVTAPELSDLFSRCVARQCGEILAHTGGDILELGAGTGRLAATVLQTLASEGTLPQRYAILEVSADLAQRQRERLAALPPSLRKRVEWLDRLPETALRGVILANEVLDALPVSRFTLQHDGQIRECGVRWTSQGFAACDLPASPGLGHAVREIIAALPEPLPEGYRSEVCLRVEPWIGGLAESLQRGVMLLFDYGLPRSHYYHPQRVDGTLRCHFKQRAHDDPFINPGVQDITAWVDFTRVAEGAVAADLEVLGFATQAGFLLATGIEALLAGAPDELQRLRLAGEARRLLLPGEMGEAVKVMALGRDHHVPLSGFTVQDLRRSL